MFKKALSILLAVMLVVSAFSMATVAVGAAADDTAVNANTEVDSVSADDTLTVKATSNLFPERTYTFTQEELAANDNKVTVTYFINSEKDMLNTQWAVRYDGDKLEANVADNQSYDEEEEVYTSTVMPRATDAVINFAPADINPGIRGNCTKLGLYKLSKKGEQTGFVTITFRAKGTGETTVDLDVEELRVSTLQPGSTQTQEADEEQLVEGSVVKDVTFNYSTVTSIYGGNYNANYTNPADQPTTAVPAEETTAAPADETTAAPAEETTVAPAEETTVAPADETTAAPAEETTAEPTPADKLNVKVTSNLFSEHTRSYDPSTKQITVVYEINCPGYAAVNADFTCTYDPAVFDYAAENTDEGICPVAGSQLVCTTPADTLFGEPGVITGNFSNVSNKLKLYNADGSPVTFFKVVFDVKDGATGDTTVDLQFKNFRICPDDKLPEQASETVIKYSQLQVPEEDLEKLNMNDYSTDGTPEEEPTTVAPVTEPTEPATEPAEDKIYSIAGDPFNSWDASDVNTEMTKGDDGKYTYTLAMDPVQNAQFKVVTNHSWDEAYGDNGNNVVFNVDTPCDVTITFDPETKEITVTGDGVSEPILEIGAIRAVGNGEGNWLNGVAWDPADDINLMNEVSDKVYEITFENVGASFGYEIKFAANGDWVANWGGVEGNQVESGTTYDGVWDGKNINIEVEEDGATVKAQLDLSNFDFASKQGAKYTITITYPGEEPTTAPAEPTTAAPVEPTTVAPVEPTTVAPVEPTTVAPEETTVPAEPTTVAPEETTVPAEPTTVAPEETTAAPAPVLHVNTTSNFFAAEDLGNKNMDETFTVAYDYQQPDDNLIVSGQWKFTYDASKVTLVDVNMPNIGEYSYVNTYVDPETGKTVTAGNFANENGFDFSELKNFVTANFKTVGDGEETIDFYVSDLLNKEWAIVKDGVIQEAPVEPTTSADETTVPAEPTTVAPVEPTTVAPVVGDFIIDAQEVTAAPVAGTTVKVPVDFTKNPGYGYGYVRVNWDKDSLVLTDIEYNNALAPKQSSAAPIENDGTYKVSFGDMMTTTPFVGTDTAFTLVFKVSDTAAQGDYAITLSDDEVYDCDINIIDSASVDGKVTLAEEEPTTAPAEPTTAAPEEPTTVAPEEPTTVAPEEPTTVAPEEPTTVAPEEPTTVAPEEPTTVAPEETTVAPEETTVAPEETTVAPEETTQDVTSSTDATSETKPATGDSTSDSTKDSPSNPNGGTNGAVQTGNASMAIIILLVLISATGAIYFYRKKVK